jgi:glycerol-3-phosphate acyltransferase PlsY
MTTGLMMLGGYLLGCVATGYYWARWRRGLDVRALGSGVTGALNVGRVLGGPGFAVTLLGDVAKGVGAVALAQWAGLDQGGQTLAAMAVVVGHVFPAQLQWRGGNGLATGALGMLDPMLGLALVGCFCASLPLLAGVKYVWHWPVKFYTPSKVTVIATPFVAMALARPWWLVGALGLIVGVIVWSVAGNLRRLAQQD